MIVVPATAADVPAIAALEDAFPTARWSASTWAKEVAAAAGADADGGRCVLVGRSGEGGLVGVVTLSHVAGVADLNRVVVAPQARRGGRGRQLVLEGLAWAAEAGAGQVMLEVDASNDPAVGLYEQVGFVALARRANYYGAGRDALVMALRIGEDA